MRCPPGEWKRNVFLWTGIPLRRVIQAPWFQMRGEIGVSGQLQFAIGNGTMIEATETGELFLYVNDVPGFYDNNHGTAKVTIRHVPLHRVQ